jgi:hypothetical protein
MDVFISNDNSEEDEDDNKNANTNAKGPATATVIVRDPQRRVVLSSPGWAVQGLVETWTAEREVLERHKTPTWVRFSPHPILRA